MKKPFLFLIITLFSIFPLSGCSNQTPGVSLSDAVTYVYKSVLDPYEESWLRNFSEEETANKFGISSSLYTEACVYASPKTSYATVFAGFRTTEDKGNDLESALSVAKQNVIIAFDGYLPDQYLIAKNAEIKQYGDYYFLVMTKQNDAVIQALEDYFKNGSSISYNISQS